MAALTSRSALKYILALTVIFLTAVPAGAAAGPGAVTVETVEMASIAGMRTFFEALGYDWSELDQDGVPSFILERIPPDINQAESVTAKKHAFFMGLLPMVLIANQEIRRERDEVQQILQRHQQGALKEGDDERIRTIAKRYGLLGHPLTDHRSRTRLLHRVAPIPPSLALAQAANESAWGTSRFAQLGNNLFGEWTYTRGTGIIPEGRPAGQTYEVRKFPSIYASIRSYLNNLNRNNAYLELREIRSRLRESGQPVTGVELARGLKRYSQRGEAYVKEIQAMIRHNQLQRINDVALRDDQNANLTTISTKGGGLFSTRNRLIGHLTPTTEAE